MNWFESRFWINESLADLNQNSESFLSHESIWIKFHKPILSRDLIWIKSCKAIVSHDFIPIKTFWGWVESYHLLTHTHVCLGWNFLGWQWQNCFPKALRTFYRFNFFILQNNSFCLCLGDGSVDLERRIGLPVKSLIMSGQYVWVVKKNMNNTVSAVARSYFWEVTSQYSCNRITRHPI